jgi:hypothetical protein
MASKIFVSLVYISIFTTCLLTESCKKNDPEVNYIVGNWKITGFIYKGEDIFGSLLPCQADNIITFTSDNRVIYDEGPTKCYSTDIQTESGTYSLSNDKKTLTLLTPGPPLVLNVITLNSTTLTFEDPTEGSVSTLTRIN